jgi:hypothetical protein
MILSARGSQIFQEAKGMKLFHTQSQVMPRDGKPKLMDRPEYDWARMPSDKVSGMENEDLPFDSIGSVRDLPLTPSEVLGIYLLTPSEVLVQPPLHDRKIPKDMDWGPTNRLENSWCSR